MNDACSKVSSNRAPHQKKQQCSSVRRSCTHCMPCTASVNGKGRLHRKLEEAAWHMDQLMPEQGPADANQD